MGSAVRMTDRVRIEWGSYDLLTPSGIKVEVKNSAYIQSWATINPLDLDQWQFFVLATSVLNERCGDQKTLGLAPLKALGPDAVTYGDLRQTVEGVAARTT